MNENGVPAASGTGAGSGKNKKKKSGGNPIPVYPPPSGARAKLRLPPSRTDPEGWYCFVPPERGSEPEREDGYP